MTRFHVHVSVNELSESIRFYSTIFGVTPLVEKEDYAKWELGDPALNFAISVRGHKVGINHFGIQVETEGELKSIAERLDSADIESIPDVGSSCCYSHSNKHWTVDPQGIAWESFHTLGDLAFFGKDTKADPDDNSSACCIPLAKGDDDNATCCIPHEGDASGCC